MNIVLVSTAYPFRGGIAHYIALLYKHLSAQHNVQVVTFSRQYPSFLFPGKTQMEEGGSDAVIPTQQTIDSINPLTWWKTAKLIAAMKPDLLIFKYWLPFFGPCFATIARLVKRWSGARSLFICDNVIPHERRLGDIAFTRYAFKSADYFIVQSTAVEKELIDFYPRAQYAYVPHPVYEIFGDPVSKQDALCALNLPIGKYLLFFGYIRKYKGLMILLEAMKELASKSDIRLLVAGEFYDDEHKYRSYITENKLNDTVHFYSDYIANNQVKHYFCASDLVVLPYSSATQSGIAQIAYQFNKPVIATDVGGLAEVVLHEKTGFIVPPNNPHALAESILRFYDEKREATFVEAVESEKKKYTWAALIEAIEKLAAVKRS